jgi:hypothetical protein
MRPFVSAVIASMAVASVTFAQAKAGATSGTSTVASSTPSEWALDGGVGFAAPDYGTASDFMIAAIGLVGRSATFACSTVTS